MKSQYRVSQAFVHNPDILALVKQSVESNGPALLPHAGVALQLHPGISFTGSVCSFFPLGIPMGLPALFHGVFDLHSSRKIVPLSDNAKDSEKLQCRWNKAILTGPMTVALIELILSCRELLPLLSKGSLGLDLYYLLIDDSARYRGQHEQ